jgi:hypothetical protein
MAPRAANSQPMDTLDHDMAVLAPKKGTREDFVLPFPVAGDSTDATQNPGLSSGNAFTN